MRGTKIIFVLGILSLIFPLYAMAFNDILSDIYCSKIVGSDDLSQFHIAACRGDVEAVRKFIEKGISINQIFIVNAQPFRGDENYHYEFNALHTAVMRYKYAEYIQELPEPLGGVEREDINKEDYRRIIELLVKNGIDAEYPFRWWISKDINTPPRPPIDEFRPINLASNYEIVELLKKGGAKTSPLIFSENKDGYNYFRGNIIVSGKIVSEPYIEEGMWSELCVYVDRDTFYLIPRVNDLRPAWFCLKKDPVLFTKMKIDREKIKHKCFSGFAKLQITNYRQYIGKENRGYDGAELVKVIETKDYSYKKCQGSQ